eukprot:TRINITY_DN19046_c0_g1_i1.p2 TRINITY_DN19046_c0_g1~~TRINITY_DN19046_c0_g1_i1.p2  ORF type:complete len:102 (-),score=30.90 TRINITY_DN19046_c0_g1_i1:149-454(-)
MCIRDRDACDLQRREARCTFETMGTKSTPNRSPGDLNSRVEHIFNNYMQLNPVALSGPEGHPLVGKQCAGKQEQCPAVPDGPWIIVTVSYTHLTLPTIYSV